MINLQNLKITQEMLNIISEIDQFKSRWYGLDKKNAELGHLQKVATIESIGSSNRIEGNKLSDTDVENILNGVDSKSFQSRDEQEVAGYAKLMRCIFDDFDIIPLTENYVKQMHQILLSYSDKDISHRGEYKKISNSVSAFDADGREIGVVFETSSPFENPEQMRELVKYIRNSLEDNLAHPLLLTALFVVHFLAIHPFQDGNGRLSRALTTLLMLKSGYSYVAYSSMETVIEGTKPAYYGALRSTQKTLKTTPNYEAWLIYFLNTVLKQKIHLEKKFATHTMPQHVNLPLTASKILSLFNEQEVWTTSEIALKFRIKPVTIKKNLAILVKSNLIKKNGSTRGAWYEKVKF